jgi:hypothetical protein
VQEASNTINTILFVWKINEKGNLCCTLYSFKSKAHHRDALVLIGEGACAGEQRKNSLSMIKATKQDNDYFEIKMVLS